MHACIMIIVHDCTKIITHACTMIKVHACTMTIVHEFGTWHSSASRSLFYTLTIALKENYHASSIEHGFGASTPQKNMVFPLFRAPQNPEKRRKTKF